MRVLVTGAGGQLGRTVARAREAAEIDATLVHYGTDFVATKSETLTFSAGQTTATFSVDTIDDQDQESDENFTVTLTNPTGATLDDDAGTGTITDNDGDDGEPEPVPALPLLGQLLLALGLAAGGARLARHRGVSPPRAV